MLKHRVLISEAAITTRVGEVAHAILRDIPTQRPIFIGLLTGSFVFLADLVRAAARLGLEPAIDFMATSHYGATIRSPGTVRIVQDVSLEVHGRAVLIVDDILDSGLTLRAVREHVAASAPGWLRTCVLLDKPSRRVAAVEADYVGFQVPDVWVIGYGLDAREEGRSLPYVGAVDPEAGSEEA